MKTKNFKFYSDAGHGWLAVKKSEIQALNVTDQISSCSYQKGKTAYLEEDCDMGIFLRAYAQKHGEESFFVLHNAKSQRDVSPIRYYERYISGVIK